MATAPPDTPTGVRLRWHPCFRHPQRARGSLNSPPPRTGGWGLVFETPARGPNTRGLEDETQCARTLPIGSGKAGGKPLSLDVLWLATPSSDQEPPHDQHTRVGAHPANRLGARPRADRPAHRTDPTPPK